MVATDSSPGWSHNIDQYCCGEPILRAAADAFAPLSETLLPLIDRLFLRPLAAILLLALASTVLIACETQAETEAREDLELIELTATGTSFMQGITDEGPDSAASLATLSTKARLYYKDSDELGDLVAYLSIGAHSGIDVAGFEIVESERNKSKGRVLVKFVYADGGSIQTYLGALFVGQRGSKEWVIDTLGDGVDLFIPGDINF